MSFPSTWEIIRHFNIFLLTGPIILSIGVGCLVRIYRIRIHQTRRRDTKSPHTIHLAVVAIFAIFIGSVHMLVYSQVATAFRFRFDPTRVAGIRVSHRSLLGADPSEVPFRKSIVINDPAFVREGVLKLATARSFQTDHEHYEGIAYRIDFRLKGPTSYSPYRWLELCDRTQRREDINVVMPHIGAGHDVRNQGGTYTCSEFHDWFTERVIPLLQESDPPSAEVPSSHDSPHTENN